MGNRERAKAFWVSMCVVLLLGGCGIKFIYNRMDFFLPWYLDDYISLDRQQRQQVREDIRELLIWHRREELPAYADWLSALALDLRQGVTAEQLAAHEERFGKFLRKLRLAVSESSLALMPTLTDQQVAGLIAELDKDNREFYEDYAALSPDEIIDKRIEDAGDFLEDWLGRLNDRQERELVRWANGVESMWLDYYSFQEVRNRDLEALLARRGEGEAFARDYAGWFDNWQDQRSPAHQRRLEANTTRFRTVMVELLNNLEPRQQERLFSRLRDFEEDLRELAAD